MVKFKCKYHVSCFLINATVAHLRRDVIIHETPVTLVNNLWNVSEEQMKMSLMKSDKSKCHTSNRLLWFGWWNHRKSQETLFRKKKWLEVSFIFLKLYAVSDIFCAEFWEQSRVLRSELSLTSLLKKFWFSFSDET